MKKKILASALIFMSAFIFAREAFFTGDDYCISAEYNDKAFPGDAVFVKMTFSQSTKKGKSSKLEFSNANAFLQFFAEGKLSRESTFFTVSKSTKSSRTFLAGIPLSTWWTEDTKCFLKIIYSTDGAKKMEFELPFTLEKKEFVSEVIDLDESNSNIKADSSLKRMEQIKKLNGILETANPSARQHRFCFLQTQQDGQLFLQTAGNTNTQMENQRQDCTTELTLEFLRARKFLLARKEWLFLQKPALQQAGVLL